MSTAHTPGPWEAVRWSDDEEWRIMGTTSTGLEGCYSVAEVFDGNGMPQNAANATLIAAAPDLLEALQEMKQLLDIVLCVQGGLPPDANGPAAKALAAIRKATGAA